MREATINILNQLFSDNLGNKITPALATGVMSLLNQELLRMEPESVQEPETQQAEGAVPA